MDNYDADDSRDIEDDGNYIDLSEETIQESQYRKRKEIKFSNIYF